MRNLKNFPGTLLLVGAGNMGGAMLKGWLDLGLDPAQVVVLETQPSLLVSGLLGRGLRLNPAAGAAQAASVVVIAVKPQAAGDVLATLGPFCGEDTLAVSIMAGRPLSFVSSLLPAGIAVVRAMPNTPAAIGRGMTVAVANERVTARQRSLANDLLAATGAVEWAEDEALIDPVTAVSGSGPAYVFLFAESLARAGVAAGLPPDLAAKLARETVAGAGELLYRSPLDPGVLRRNVTSPGGTTAAALEVLMGPDGLDALMERAVLAAARRARELAG